MSRIKLFFLPIFLLIFIFSEAQTIEVGAAKRDITPHPLLPVSGGIGTPNQAHIQKGSLSARAMVIKKGDQQLAIVNIDNLGWPAALGDLSRALIPRIPPEHILIGSTHTHSAPDAYGFPDETGKVSADMDYLNWCVQQIADAVNEALDHLQPASLKIAVGKAEGKIAYNYYAPQLYDPRCGVIQAVDKSGQPIVTLVNYAIHPEVIGSGRDILSPDLVGPLYDRIESRTGGMALFMNGAQGGMVTADNRLPDGGEANNWEECIRIGRLLADEALKIVDKSDVIDNPRLSVISKKIKLPVANKTMQLIAKLSPLQYGFENDSIATQVNLVQIGDARILTIPGEALPNIGYYLKRKMDTKLPFLFGLTNDAFGYMLTKVDFNSFDRYKYISRTSLGEMVAEVYMEEALKMIQEMSQSEKK